MDRYSKPERVYSYQYQSDNRSILAKPLRVWWKAALRAVPLNVSPNAISMVGNLGSLFCLFLLVGFGSVYGPDRPWIFALAALGIFVYHTLDSIDGMQARRLGISGPLGEFIDHWFDSFNVFFVPLGFLAAFPSIPTWAAVAVVVGACMADWIALREVEETNILYFPPVSSEEALVAFILFNLSVAFLGYGFWSAPTALFGLSLAGILAVLVAFGFACQIFKGLWRSRGRGSLGLFLMALLMAPSVVWIVECDFLFADRVALVGGLFAIGFTGARLVGDLLRTRLVGLRYPFWYADSAATGIVMLLSVAAMTFFPGLPAWLPVLAMFIHMTVLLLGLYTQFLRMLKRVYDCLGIGLFDTVPASERRERIPARADAN